MLRSFRVANHKSIRDEQELLLLPVYEADHTALPVAAIYGANASGKSNLLDALGFMRAAVVDSYPRWEPDQGIPRQPFRLDPKARQYPSDFVVDVELGDVRYTYGFSVDNERVIEEWLHSYPERRRRIIFERSGSEIKFGSTTETQRGTAAALEGLTRPNALFLSVASRANFPALLPMYQWFLRSLRTGFARQDEISEDRMAEFYSRSDRRRSILLDLVRFADFGITDLHVKDDTDPTVEARVVQAQQQLAVLNNMLTADRGAQAAQLREAVQTAETAFRSVEQERRRSRQRRFLFLHSTSKSPFGLADESDGTRAWLGMLYLALPALETGRTLVVDEIDTSLHPRLTARLIALFQDKQTNPDRAQLICTTHDTTLLSPTLGEEVLRRDQVWFTEKDESGATALYPLSDFKPRKGENTERRYLGGSYGAVPRLFPEDFVMAVRESRTADGKA